MLSITLSRPLDYLLAWQVNHLSLGKSLPILSGSPVTPLDTHLVLGYPSSVLMALGTFATLLPGGSHRYAPIRLRKIEIHPEAR